MGVRYKTQFYRGRGESVTATEQSKAIPKSFPPVPGCAARWEGATSCCHYTFELFENVQRLNFFCFSELQPVKNLRYSWRICLGMQKKRPEEDFPCLSKDLFILAWMMLGRTREPNTSWSPWKGHPRQTIAETLDCHPKPLSRHFHHQQCYQSPGPRNHVRKGKLQNYFICQNFIHEVTEWKEKREPLLQHFKNGTLMGKKILCSGVFNFTGGDVVYFQLLKLWISSPLFFLQNLITPGKCCVAAIQQWGATTAKLLELIKKKPSVGQSSG